jgi:adenylate cyclase
LWVPYAQWLFGVVASVPVGLAYRFVRETLLRSAATREREQMMGLFSRYVSPELAEEIWSRRSEVVLGGEQRTATVLFSDIRGFTAMTAGRPSEEVLRWLNRYLAAMDEVIRAHGGLLNKFIGDGIMVLFGVPLSDGVERDAARAVQAALAMLRRLEADERGGRTLAGFGPLRIGIGIHTGPLTSGNVGSESRLEYSVIGETVNLASRLESLTKDLHVPIVLSQATAEAIGPDFPGLRAIGDVPVRGFEGTLRVYTVDRTRDLGGTT